MKRKQGWVTGNRSDGNRDGKEGCWGRKMVLIFSLLICSCQEKYPGSGGNKPLGLLDSRVENGILKTSST